MARARTITLHGAHGAQLPALLTTPAQGSGPGLLLLHDMFGVNDFMRAMAERLAEEGYVCLVPDLYWRLAPGVSFEGDESDRERAQALRERFDIEMGLDDVAASFAALCALDERAGKLGIIGWSLGGMLALRAAARLEVGCVVSYYGSGLDQHVDTLTRIGCPTLLHVGDADAKIPAASREALARAAAANAHVELAVYPGCGHGFDHPRHANFDKPAAMMAYSRSIALLRRELGPIYDLSRLWDAHTLHEFATRDVDATMATMVDEPYVNHIPTMTGGVGHQHLKRFYKYHFVNSNPPDTRLIPVSRTIGADRLVDEMVFCFTHTCEIPWMLPGVAPTGRYVEIPLVAIVNFRGDKLYHEHIYWDQASVLVQIGALEAQGLPVAGIATAKKLVDETLPSNELMADGWAKSAGLPL
jgi:carboxymethylenebutenolidase